MAAVALGFTPVLMLLPFADAVSWLFFGTFVSVVSSWGRVLGGSDVDGTCQAGVVGIMAVKVVAGVVPSPCKSVRRNFHVVGV